MGRPWGPLSIILRVVDVIDSFVDQSFSIDHLYLIGRLDEDAVHAERFMAVP